MAVEPDYKADYRSSDNKIIITGKNVNPAVEIPLEDLTQYKYTSAVQPAEHNPGGTYAEWVDFQKRIRVFDMIKDGHVARKGKGPIPNAADTICNLMYPATCGVPYTSFVNMIGKIRSDVEQKIIKTTWTNPNEKFQRIRKLDRRNTYKESGIGPEHVISDPIYCTNIATEIIDPLRRTYPPSREKKRFPLIGESLVITEAFYNFFGLEHCSLIDRRIGDITHAYQLQITDGIILPNNASQNWYGGNIIKNQYFKDHASNHSDTRTKKGLLNSKELGDVSQVGNMFIATKIKFNGGNHTMVTGDEIVFILCILLRLDCIFYYHPKKSNHQIFHFKGEYNLADAVADYDRIRKEIEETNNAIMFGILEIFHNPNITVELRGFSPIDNFKLPDELLQDMIVDILQFNHALIGLTHTEIYRLNPQVIIDDRKISLLIRYMTIIKEQYKVKEPFTFTKGRPTIVTFNTSYKSYTHVIPDIPDIYYLKGYNHSRTFYEIYKKYYLPNQVQGGSHVRVQKGGNKEQLFSEIDGTFRSQYNPQASYIDIFELSDYPVLVTVKDKYYEDVDIESDSPAVEIDVHAQWRELVKQIVEPYLAVWPELPFYDNDIWWELYNSYYIKNGNINESQLRVLIDSILQKLKKAHDKNIKVASGYVSANREPSPIYNQNVGHSAFVYTPPKRSKRSKLSKSSKLSKRFKLSKTQKQKSKSGVRNQYMKNISYIMGSRRPITQKNLAKSTRFYKSAHRTKRKNKSKGMSLSPLANE